MNTTYSMSGSAVVIHQDRQKDMILSESSLRTSIKFVREHKEQFKTELAWWEDVCMRENALVFLLFHLPK